MAGGDHLVIDLHVLAGRAEVAGKAFFAAYREALVIDEAELDHVDVLGACLDVGAEPGGGRAVAALAADAFGDVKLATTMLIVDAEGVADEAALSLFGRADLEDRAHLAAE